MALLSYADDLLTRESHDLNISLSRHRYIVVVSSGWLPKVSVSRHMYRVGISDDCYRHCTFYVHVFLTNIFSLLSTLSKKMNRYVHTDNM